MRPVKSIVLFSILLVLVSSFAVSPAAALPNPAGDPAIVSISPSHFASGINQPVTISGTHLSAASFGVAGDKHAAQPAGRQRYPANGAGAPGRLPRGAMT